MRAMLPNADAAAVLRPWLAAPSSAAPRAESMKLEHGLSRSGIEIVTGRAVRHVRRRRQNTWRDEDWHMQHHLDSRLGTLLDEGHTGNRITLK